MRRLLLFIVRAGSRLAPPARRAAWEREWRGEVVHALDRLEAGAGSWRKARLLLRTAWCLADALALRREDLRMRGIGTTFRATLRGLRRSPGFTLPVLLTLVVGIGACTSVFSVAYAVLMRPLPFPDPDRLAVVWGQARAAGVDRLPVDAPDVERIRERGRSLEGVAFVQAVADGNLTGGGAGPITLARVTGNLFEVLGANAALGRTLRPSDGHLTPAQAARDDDDLRPLPPTVVVLSDGFWRSRFGADPGVLGRTIRVDGNPAVVVGVMPPGFRIPAPPGAGVPARVDAWTPVRFDLALLRRTERFEDQDSQDAGLVLVRRRAAATADVTAELEAAARDIRSASPSHRDMDYHLVQEPLGGAVAREARPLLLALFGATVLIILIGCLNVAGLLYARSLARGRDRALRAALGAGRGRLAGEAFLEAGVLAAVGGAGGVILAVLATPRLVATLPASVPRLGEVAVSLPVLVFALGLTALAAILFGALPALRSSRVDATATLAGRTGTGTGSTGVRAALVAGQLALVTALLVGSGLLLETVRNLTLVHPGFQPEALAFDLDLAFRDGYRGPGDRARFLTALEEDLAALPGVRAVGTTASLPLDDRRFVQPYALPGEGPLGQHATRRADFRVVTAGYFRAAGTRLLAGRGFTPADDDQDRRVAIVDETLATRIASDPASATGRFIRIPVDGREVTAEIVGVAENVRHEGLRQGGRPAVYVPYRHEASRNITVLVRADDDPTSLVPAIRAAIARLDPRLAVHDVRTLADLVASAMAPTRFLLRTFAALGMLSLVLAAIGVFGVVGFEVRRRRREIGVRAALGATRASLMRMTLGRSLALGAAGAAAGLLVAWLSSRLLDAVLYQASPAEPGIMAAASVVILLTTVLASWLPAREAARANPMDILREE